MNKVKITVLKCTCNEELAKEYGVEGLGVCNYFNVGDTFITDYRKPEGFCEDAWQAIQYYAFGLAMGTPRFYDDWVKDEGVAINCCNDGIRPVIFKLERIDEEWSNSGEYYSCIREKPQLKGAGDK